MVRPRLQTLAIPRSAQLKLQRAQEHIDALDQAIKTFLADDPYSAERVVEGDGTEHIVRWVRYQEPPASFGLIAGDAIHNARSSLDHMIVWLAQQGAASQSVTLSDGDLRNLQFPVTMNSAAFGQAVARGRLEWLTQDARERVEHRQPYNTTVEPPERFFLSQVAELDNADKHRNLTVAVTAPVVVKVNWPTELQGLRLVDPHDPQPPGPGVDMARFVLPRPYAAEEIPIKYQWGFVLRGSWPPGIHDIRYTLNGYLESARFTAEYLSQAT